MLHSPLVIVADALSDIVPSWTITLAEQDDPDGSLYPAAVIDWGDKWAYSQGSVHQTSGEICIIVINRVAADATSSEAALAFGELVGNMLTDLMDSLKNSLDIIEVNLGTGPVRTPWAERVDENDYYQVKITIKFGSAA